MSNPWQVDTAGGDCSLDDPGVQLFWKGYRCWVPKWGEVWENFLDRCSHLLVGPLFQPLGTGSAGLRKCVEAGAVNSSVHRTLAVPR